MDTRSVSSLLRAIAGSPNPLLPTQLIKTHLYPSMTSKNQDAKYLYVSRNPKDVVVSFYHHTVGFPRHYDFASGSFDTYFELFLDGKVDHGKWRQKWCHSWSSRVSSAGWRLAGENLGLV